MSVLVDSGSPRSYNIPERARRILDLRAEREQATLHSSIWIEQERGSQGTLCAVVWIGIELKVISTFVSFFVCGTHVMRASGRSA